MSSLRIPAGQQLAQRLGLRDVAREAVEQEAALRVILQQPGLDHGDGDLVRDQVTAIHERLGLAAEFGAGADVVPEDVACRDLRDRQV